MKFEFDPQTVAAEIIALIDDRGPGLSQQREKELTAKVSSILKRHQSGTATRQTATKVDHP